MIDLAKILPIRALSRPIVACSAIGALASVWSFTGARRLVNDNDVWWIAAAGREILRTHSVPRTNGFSFAEPDHPWVMHEWLHGPIYARGLESFGPKFFSIWATFVGLITLALALAVIARQTKSLGTAALATIFALVPLGDVFHSPRPSFASMWLPAAMVLVAMKPWTRANAIASIGIAWLWTQLHGSFPIGLAILGCAALEDRTTKRAITFALACAITFANPYGAKLHALVFGYGVGSNESMQWLHTHIVEFFPVWRVIGTPWFSPHAAVTLAITIAIAVHALARKRSIPRALFVLALSAMAILHVRHWALASFSGALLLAPEIDRLAQAQTFSFSTFFAGSLAPPALAAVLSLATVSHETWIAPSLGSGSVSKLEVPKDANVYADQAFASIVIWDGHRVFYDLRNDCYSRALLDEYEKILEHDPMTTEILRAHGTTHAIVRKDDPVFSSWTLVQTIGDVALYRASSTN